MVKDVSICGFIAFCFCETCLYSPSCCISSPVIKNEIYGHSEGASRSQHHHLFSASVLNY